MSIENAFLEELQRVIESHPRGYQTHVANELGIRTATFSNMVNGRRGIDETTRAKIAMLAGISLEELMRRERPDQTAKKEPATRKSCLSRLFRFEKISGNYFTAPPTAHSGEPVEAEKLRKVK